MTIDLGSAIFGTWFLASTDGAFTVDRVTGTITCSNPQFAAMIGRDPETLIGASLASLLYLPVELNRAGHHEHLAFRTPHGRPMYITLTATVVAHLGEGDLLACLGRDTCARYLLELEHLARHSRLFAANGDLEQLVGDLSDAKLQLEDRNHEIAALAGQVSRFGWRAAVGELVAGIAHHLNNPVGALASTLRRLETKVVEVPDPLLRGSLQQLVQRGREIGSRIEDNVNAVVRAHEAGTADTACQWLVLQHEIETALSMFADRLQHVMVVRDYGDEPPVLVPHDSLHLVMSNLIDNSLRAMKDRGTLRIAVRRTHGHVALRITDTGGGVPAHVLPLLFEPILSARPGGAGLGLSTAQRLARAWGGDVGYHPVAHGSVFEISIPVRDVGAAASPPGSPRRPRSSSRRLGAIAPLDPRRRRLDGGASQSQEANEDPS